MSANPYAPPLRTHQVPTLHWREDCTPEDLARERDQLATHCADATQATADRIHARPRPRGLTLTLASLGSTALVLATVIVALGLLLERDRTMLLALAGLCSGLATLLIITARRRHLGNQRHAEDDRKDPVLTMRAWLEALSHGHGGEVLCRLAPSARQRVIEAPDLSPHRSRAAYPLHDPEAIEAWCKTFARSDPVQPRWMLVRTVELERQDGDLAFVRTRVEVRWWALWGVVAVGGIFLPLLFFALIPGLLLYLALMQRRVVVATKLVLRGPDDRWYVLRPELAPEG